MRAVGYNETTDKVKISPYLPDFVADGILNVDFEQLKRIGVKHLLMDLDNTLRQAYSRKLDQEVIDFFAKVSQKYGFKSVNLVSNNNRNLSRYATPLKARVFQPFWRHGIMVRKPSVRFYQRVLDELQIDPKSSVMIGDKVRLDVAGANKVGIYTVLVRRRGRDYWFDYLLLARWREYRTLAAALKTKSKHLHSTPNYIQSRLKDFGIKAGSVSAPTHLPGGALIYTAEQTKQPVTIKVLTRWGSTAHWTKRLWRYLRPSWNGEEPPYFGPKHILEREAYIQSMAQSADVRTPDVLGVIDLGDYRFGLVSKHIDGEPLDLLPKRRVNTHLLEEMWRQVLSLHKHQIAHGDCRIANIPIDTKNQPWLINFGFGSTNAAHDVMQRDLIELLVSMALAVGPELAVETISTTLSYKQLQNIRPEIRISNLSLTTRNALKLHTQNIIEQLTELIEKSSRKNSQD